MHVHLIAVAGTGMGALAGLFKAMGHQVSGSDVAFDPPMGPALRSWGIDLMQGFDPSHLEPAPDLVVVGNVCRATNPEARAAIDRGLRYSDMAHALADHVLDGTSPLVVAGTHGKTTTTAMCSFLLHDAGKAPGFLIGGLPKNFPHSFEVPSRNRSLPVCTEGGFSPDRRVPFVVEGDEYDTAFFEKTPKFWHYRPEVAILTSIEQDHIDIYPRFESCLEAFAEFVRRIPPHGLLVAAAFDPHVVKVVLANARCEVAWYALQGDDTHGQSPHWLGAAAPMNGSGQAFDLFAGGVASGRFVSRLPGLHNVRNTVAALAAVTQGFGVSLSKARESLLKFEGVRRRQDLIGEPRGIRVYDDFAHHPTAVEETLRALRAKHPQGQLLAVFEPRSATACRSLHQQRYKRAFGAADRVVLAPLGRHNIAPDEQLDLGDIAQAIAAGGTPVHTPSSIDEIVHVVVAHAHPGDTVALLSNGAFGGLHSKLLKELAQ